MTLKKFLDSNIFYSIIIFLVCIFLYGGLSVNELGLYSDDWERIYYFGFDDSGNLGGKFSSLIKQSPGIVYRITWLFVIPLTSQLGDLIGNSVLSMHLLSLFINYLNILAIFFLILKITKVRLNAFLFSIFVSTIPGRSATFFWASTQIEMVSILFIFLALNVHFNLKISKWLSSLLVFIFTLISAWSYEIAVFLPGIFLIFILFKKERKTIAHFLSSLAAVVLVLLFKFYIYPNLLNLEVVKIPQEADSLSGVFSKIIIVTKTLFSKINAASLFSYWREYIDNPKIFIIVACAVFFLVTLLFFNITITPTNQNFSLLLIGLGILFGSIVVIALTLGNSLSFNIYGKESRFTSLPAIGLGFIICYLFSSFMLTEKNTRFFAYALFAIFISLNLRGVYTERIAYIKSWEIQKDVLDKIDFSAIKGNENVMVFVSGTEKLLHTDYSVPVFADFWTLSRAFSLYSNNPNVLADFASYPYRKLDRNGGYQSKYWDKLYYERGSVYQVDLQRLHPKIIPIQEGI